MQHVRLFVRGDARCFSAYVDWHRMCTFRMYVYVLDVRMRPFV
jgi:hypothetical protein